MSVYQVKIMWGGGDVKQKNESTKQKSEILISKSFFFFVVQNSESLI